MSDYPEGLVVYYSITTKAGIVNTALPSARSICFEFDHLIIFDGDDKLLATFNWASIASILPLQTVGPTDENLPK